MDYKKLSRVFDMARVNKGENEIFPYTSYKLTMWSSDHIPPHFHIESNQEGYCIKSDLDGNLIEVVRSGKRKSKSLDRFIDVEKSVKEWLSMKSKDPEAEGKLNREWLLKVWNIIH